MRPLGGQHAPDAELCFGREAMSADFAACDDSMDSLAVLRCTKRIVTTLYRIGWDANSGLSAERRGIGRLLRCPPRLYSCKAVARPHGTVLTVYICTVSRHNTSGGTAGQHNRELGEASKFVRTYVFTEQTGSRQQTMTVTTAPTQANVNNTQTHHTRRSHRRGLRHHMRTLQRGAAVAMATSSSTHSSCNRITHALPAQLPQTKHKNCRARTQPVGGHEGGWCKRASYHTTMGITPR